MYRKRLKTRGTGKVQFRDTPLDLNTLHDRFDRAVFNSYDLIIKDELNTHGHASRDFYYLYLPDPDYSEIGEYYDKDFLPDHLELNSDQALVEFVKVGMFKHLYTYKRW